MLEDTGRARTYFQRHSDDIKHAVQVSDDFDVPDLFVIISAKHFLYLPVLSCKLYAHGVI